MGTAVSSTGSSRLHRWAYSTTEVDLRAVRPAGLAMLALGAVLPHLPGRPGLPCPLRTITGVPCPFCGCTTAVEAVMHGHLSTALSASPLGVLIAALAALVIIRPRWARTRLAILPILVLVALSWLFELGRYGVL